MFSSPGVEIHCCVTSHNIALLLWKHATIIFRGNWFLNLYPSWTWTHVEYQTKRNFKAELSYSNWHVDLIRFQWNFILTLLIVFKTQFWWHSCQTLLSQICTNASLVYLLIYCYFWYYIPYSLSIGKIWFKNNNSLFNKGV